MKRSSRKNKPMNRIARTLRLTRRSLLNYFKVKKQFSSGAVEFLNNKAEVLRRSYGSRTFRIRELTFYQSPGRLPEPELTDEFS